MLTMKEHLHGNQTMLKLVIAIGTGENRTTLGAMKTVLSFVKLYSHINGVTATVMGAIPFLLRILLCVKSFNKL